MEEQNREMIPLNVTTAVITSKNITAVANYRYQYDTGQILKIVGVDLPFAYQVDFSNYEEDEDSIPQIGNAEGVRIPDEVLQTGMDVWAFVYLHEGLEDGETQYKIHIPVKKRTRITNQVPTPEEQSEISQAIVVLNQGVEAAKEAQRKAEEAQGKAEEAEDGAEGYKKDAEAWATGKRDGQDVGPGDETYQNSARFYAMLAEQGAESAGYAWFDVDDETGEMIVTVADDLSEEVEFEVNEELGILEVIVK